LVSQVSEQGGTTVQFHSITALDQFKNKSFEELRLEDYKRLKGGVSTPTPAGSSALTSGYQSKINISSFVLLSLNMFVFFY
jgi:hypothetical protein